MRCADYRGPDSEKYRLDVGEHSLLLYVPCFVFLGVVYLACGFMPHSGVDVTQIEY